MSASLLKTVLRDQLRRPWLALLMIVSVALGVGVVVAVDLANQAATRAFELSTEVVIGKATHQIVGGPAGIDEAVYRHLRVDEGVRLSAPIVEGYAPSPQLGGQTMHVFGVDLFAETPFRSYLTNSQRLSIQSLSAFFAEPGAVFISADSASRYGIKTGDSATIQVGTQARTVTIAGLLQPPNDVSARALEGLMLTDISTAQELFGSEGRLSRIDLIATPAEAEAIARTLPAGLRVASASEQAETVTQLTAAFQLNLTAISLLSLVVGMFLIYNTVMFSVVQRRRVLGILRSIGVTGREIFGLILFEAVLGGALGALLGLGLGVLLGRLTVALVTRTINDLYYSLTVNGVQIETASLVKGFVLGLTSAVTAAAAPAAEASTIPPVSVLQRSDLETRVRKWIPALSWLGLLLIAAGAAILFLIPNIITSFAGIFLAVFGAVLIVPVLTVLLMRLAAATIGRIGLTGRMAARTVTMALSRTSIAIAALMVAVSVTIGVTIMIASFRSTVAGWLGQTISADLFVQPPGLNSDRTVSLPPDAIDRMKAVPGVASMELLRYGFVGSPQFGEVRITAVDAGRQRNSKDFRTVGGNPDEIWRRFDAGAVFITEPFANRHHLAVGQQVTLITDRGPVDFPIAAVFYDYSSDQGYALMSLDVYRAHWDDPGITGAAFYVEPGTDVEQVGDALRRAVGGQQLVVQSNKALRDSALVVFDRTFAITSTLRIIAVVVAFIGILSALMALQIERTRELATLRAEGMTVRQLWQLTLLESGLMGATAGLLSIPAGVGLAAALIYFINLRSFGWTIFFSPVPETFAEALAISILAALLATVYPMVRLGRLETAVALREE
ncbi:MAG: FtsX-like permease family protein [Rudaea sp.]